jgi:DNA-binding MarR family transcriptional regulator
MNRDELVQDIIENLAKCQRPSLSTAWKDLGLSHAQAGMLYLLYFHDEANVKEVAEFLGVSKSAVTQLLVPLADKGLVKRTEDPKDRRVVHLSLTGRGSTALKNLAKHKYAGLRSSLESLSAKELRQLDELHRKMTSSVGTVNKIKRVA